MKSLGADAFYKTMVIADVKDQDAVTAIAQVIANTGRGYGPPAHPNQKWSGAF